MVIYKYNYAADLYVIYVLIDDVTYFNINNGNNFKTLVSAPIIIKHYQK